MTAERLDRDPLIAKIRQQKAVELELTLADGTSKKVAIPKAGNKWAKLTETLEAYDWHYLEMLDDKARSLGRIENDADEETAEDFDAEGDGACSKCGRKTEAKVLLEVMRMTQRETRLLFAATLDGSAKVMEQNAKMTENVVEACTQSMQLRDGAGAAESATGMPKELMEMLNMFQMLKASGGLPKLPGSGS